MSKELKEEILDYIAENKNVTTMILVNNNEQVHRSYVYKLVNELIKEKKIKKNRGKRTLELYSEDLDARPPAEKVIEKAKPEKRSSHKWPIHPILEDKLLSNQQLPLLTTYLKNPDLVKRWAQELADSGAGEDMAKALINLTIVFTALTDSLVYKSYPDMSEAPDVSKNAKEVLEELVSAISNS